MMWSVSTQYRSVDEMEKSTFKSEEQKRKYFQELQGSRIRKNAYSDWAGYREQVTEFILAHTEQGKSIAIFGAGRCSDVDIGMLAEYFSAVWLIDFQEHSMREALEHYGLSGHKNVHLLVRDFVGITQEEYHSLIDLCVMISEGRKNETDLTERLNQIYDRIQNHKIGLEEYCFDYGVIIGLHSQLNDTADWICTDIAHRMNLEEDFFQSARARIRQENEILVHRFNDAVFRCCTEKLFVGYEEGVSGDYRYVQGAIDAYYDLRRRELQGAIRSAASTHITWPYDTKNGICFSMVLEEFGIK